MMTRLKWFSKNSCNLIIICRRQLAYIMSARRSGVVKNKLPTAHLNSVICLPNDWDNDVINILQLAAINFIISVISLL